MSHKRLLTIVLALLLAVLVACTPSTEAPTPVPPTEDNGAIDLTPPANDELWEQIDSAGRIVAGVSADYPPFEFYTDEFVLDGFDIALMRALGREMGVEVQFKDMAFDGLGGALQLGQIDVAISAISYTPERDMVVDFSNTYFLSADAIIALADSNIEEITDVTELANLRVGVQDGSVYEDWIRDTLIDTELMPESNLFVYRELNTAGRDLEDGRIDVFVLDLLPAETAVEEFGNVAIVGQDLNRQRLAIAMPENQETLKTEINDALLSLMKDGTVTELISEYMGLDAEDILPIPPTEPEEPEGGINPEPACIDGLALVSDITYDDGNMTNPPALQPGEPFQKGWRIRNIGTCSWDSNYIALYVSGNVPSARMGGVPVAVNGIVEPGQTYDLYVNLVAPLTPGPYQAFWSMRNPQGLLFGEKMTIGIVVVSNPTPTPLPTQTPSPTINFTADNTSLKQGECTTLRWNVENVSAVYLYAQGQPWQNNPVAGSGTRTVCPTDTTVYELRVINNDGSTEIRQIRIEVQPVASAPQINYFTANPTSIQAGHCTDLSWQVTGQVDRVEIKRNGNVLWNAAPLSGRLQDCPRDVGTVEYALEASGTGGVSRKTAYVTVNQIVNTPTPTPAPTTTPMPQPPAIYSFAVSPTQISTGECVRITWNTGGGTTNVRIVRDGQTLLDNAPLTGTETDCLSTAGTYNYGVEVRNAAGANAFRDQNVIVHDVEPENPLAGTSWVLTGGSSPGTVWVLIPGTTISASFSAENQLSGTSGCNTYGSTYSVNGSSISIGVPAASNISCGDPEGVMQQEASYLAALPQMTSFQISGSQLTLSGGGTTMTFQPGAQPR